MSQYLIPVTIIAFVASLIGSLLEMSMMTEVTQTVSMAGCTFNGDGKGNMMGMVTISQEGDTATYSLNLSGLTPNMQHGFHVHQYGSLADDCAGAGGHYNPFQARQ